MKTKCIFVFVGSRQPKQHIHVKQLTWPFKSNNIFVKHSLTKTLTPACKGNPSVVLLLVLKTITQDQQMHIHC